MTNNSIPYREVRNKNLQKPGFALAYLIVCLEDSSEALLTALQNVAESQHVTLTETESRTIVEQLVRDGAIPTETQISAALASVGIHLTVADATIQEAA